MARRYEEIAIAAWLLALWRSERQATGRSQPQRFVDLATETERQLVAKARDALRENARLRRDMTKATTEAVDAQRAATEPVLETSTAERPSITIPSTGIRSPASNCNFSTDVGIWSIKYNACLNWLLFK